MAQISKTTLLVPAGGTTSETLIVPDGMGVVRVRTPVMSVATSVTIEGSVDDGVTYDVLYVAGTGASVSATVGGTPRSFQYDPNFTRGLSRVRIKTNGSEATDKNFEVILSS
jgi:hypothetical protein